MARARLTRKAMTRAVKAMAGLYCRSRGYSSTKQAEIVSKAPDTVARQDSTTRLKRQVSVVTCSEDFSRFRESHGQPLKVEFTPPGTFYWVAG